MAPPAHAEPDLTPYSGLGTWISIYRPQAWRAPAPTSARIAARGAQTLYLQTGNYRQRADLVRAGGLGSLVEAAHAQGLQVVAWYLPSFAFPGLDLRRALAAIRFRTPRGERFDSFALDIEASVAAIATRARTAREGRIRAIVRMPRRGDSLRIARADNHSVSSLVLRLINRCPQGHLPCRHD